MIINASNNARCAQDKNPDSSIKTRLAQISPTGKSKTQALPTRRSLKPETASRARNAPRPPTTDRARSEETHQNASHSSGSPARPAAPTHRPDRSSGSGPTPHRTRPGASPPSRRRKRTRFSREEYAEIGEKEKKMGEILSLSLSLSSLSALKNSMAKRGEVLARTSVSRTPRPSCVRGTVTGQSGASCHKVGTNGISPEAAGDGGGG
ncbi:hypothetical protein NL676_023612 [Syzygium grande]|nr:hypothetical protein NL676_023612 [Syzygium grande]